MTNTKESPAVEVCTTCNLPLETGYFVARNPEAVQDNVPDKPAWYLSITCPARCNLDMGWFRESTAAEQQLIGFEKRILTSHKIG